MTLSDLLQKSARDHSHLCPRQILGVRLGLAGMKALGFDAPPPKKRLLVSVETDDCFADGVITATDCTVGHRTLRVEDYGKVAAVFVDVKTGYSIRTAPVLDIRQKAYAYAPDELRHHIRPGNTAGDDFEARFAWRRFGQRRFGELQNINPAMFVENDFLHAASPFVEVDDASVNFDAASKSRGEMFALC